METASTTLSYKSLSKYYQIFNLYLYSVASYQLGSMFVILLFSFYAVIYVLLVLLLLLTISCYFLYEVITSQAR